jgi:hypothetical protein
MVIRSLRFEILFGREGLMDGDVPPSGITSSSFEWIARMLGECWRVCGGVDRQWVFGIGILRSLWLGVRAKTLGWSRIKVAESRKLYFKVKRR